MSGSNEEDAFKNKLSGCSICCYIGVLVPFIIACEKGNSSDYNDGIGCEKMAKELFQVMLVYILCVSVQLCVLLAGTCGFLDDAGSKASMIAKAATLVSGLINLGFVMNYIINGWTNEDDASGIDKFHELCNDDDLGDWAYGMMMFFTVILSIAGGLIAIALCCVVGSLLCGGALKFPYGR